VFVEVKTRTSTAYGLPQDAVTAVKQEKIRRVALSYMQQNRMDDSVMVRFDVVGVMLGHSPEPEITHIPDAF
jgi:putative endonuclease